MTGPAERRSEIVAPEDVTQRYALEERRMTLDAGWLGKFFGSATYAPTNIAGFTVCLLILIFFILLFVPLSPHAASRHLPTEEREDMAVPTMDFDWLLDQASAIAFEPGRPSLYVFGLDMTPEELHAHVLGPMGQHNLFAVAQTQFLDASRRGRYKGQLPRVGLTLFEVAGRQCGVVLSYHSQFAPDLAQYEAWLAFWHKRLLEAAQAKAQP